jgi:hypothetical protein
MSVSKGSVSDFKAAFTMVKIDGTGRHTHGITNMKTSNSSSIQLDKNGTTLIIGTADVLSNGENKWNSADVIVSIDHINVISIAPSSAATDNHFQGQPIYGVIDSLTEESGKELVQSQASTSGTNATSTSGTNATANNTEANPVSQLTEQLKNLLSGNTTNK